MTETFHTSIGILTVMRFLTRARAIDPFYYAGAFFVCAQIFILSSLVFDPVLQPFFWWSCNNFCILLAVACFRRDMQMVKGISYLGLVSQILWILDLNSHILGFNLSGVTDYIYLEGFTYANEVSIGIHGIIPVAILLFSFRTRPTIHSLFYAVPYTLFLYVVTLLFTPAAEDVNCVFSGCTMHIPLPYAVWMWPFYAFISIVLGYFIHRILFSAWNYGVLRYRKSGKN